jgi:hypothetical protein
MAPGLRRMTCPVCSESMASHAIASRPLFAFLCVKLHQKREERVGKLLRQFILRSKLLPNFCLNVAKTCRPVGFLLAQSTFCEIEPFLRQRENRGANPGIR